MANKKISQLDPSSVPLSGTELLPIVQGGTTVQATTQDVADLAFAYKHYAVLLTYDSLLGPPVFTVGDTRINEIGDGSGDGINDISWSYVGGVITGSMTTGNVFENNKLVVTAHPTLGSGNVPIIMNPLSNQDVTLDDTKLYIVPINTTNGSTLSTERWSTVVEIKRFN